MSYEWGLAHTEVRTGVAVYGSFNGKKVSQFDSIRDTTPRWRALAALCLSALPWPKFDSTVVGAYEPQIISFSFRFIKNLKVPKIGHYIRSEIIREKPAQRNKYRTRGKEI